MITLEQFRATGVDVADITDYNGADNDQGRGKPGRVYMDGTLNIEWFNDGTGVEKWLLVIGNDEHVGSLPAMEALLYTWAKDEYGLMFDTEYRIPPCPINPTEEQMREWFEEMHRRGLSFHPDDRPEEVVSGTQNKFLFYDNEVEVLRRIMADLFRLHGERVYEVANEVAGITEEEDE